MRNLGSAFEHLQDKRFVARADGFVRHVAVFKQHQRGNAHHAVLARELRLLVDIDLSDLDGAVFFRDLIHDGRDHAARAAPWRPEIDQNLFVALQYLFFKICTFSVKILIAKEVLSLMEKYSL